MQHTNLQVKAEQIKLKEKHSCQGTLSNQGTQCQLKSTVVSQEPDLRPHAAHLQFMTFVKLCIYLFKDIHFISGSAAPKPEFKSYTAEDSFLLVLERIIKLSP